MYTNKTVSYKMSSLISGVLRHENNVEGNWEIWHQILIFTVIDNLKKYSSYWFDLMVNGQGQGLHVSSRPDRGSP